MAYATRSEVLYEIREAVSDTDTVSPRWSNSDLYRYIQAGELAIVQIKPEAQYVERVKRVAVPLLTDASVNLSIEDIWADALVHYVASRVYTEDKDDTGNNQLAIIHKNEFNQRMGLVR